MSAIVDSMCTSPYTDEQRREVAAHYVVMGNVVKVAETTGIPRRTIAGWKQSDWWEPLIATVRQEKQDEIDAKMTKIIDSATEALQARIVEGDEVVTKDGDRVRKAMTGRDLATVTGIIFDKRQILRNLPTSIRAESTDQRLADLADKVRELQGGTKTIDQAPNAPSMPQTSAEPHE